MMQSALACLRLLTRGELPAFIVYLNTILREPGRERKFIMIEVYIYAAQDSLLQLILIGYCNTIYYNILGNIMSL